MRILSIETSCDETAIALVEIEGGVKNLKFKIIKSLVASQIKLHAPFGGVVPNLAKREHQKNLPILFSKIFSSTKSQASNIKQITNSKTKNHNKYKLQATSYTIQNVDLIAVTVGPGLEPALWTGIQFAKELADKYKKPIVGANHLDGHLYSFLLAQKTVNPKSQISNLKKIQNTKYKIQNTEKLFPAISLIVSGGHTILAVMDNLKKYKKLGETLDDAVGESFDKVARLLNLPYPGGPALEKIARKGDSNSIPFPSPMINQKNYDFSYSGLKTSVLYYLKNLGSNANDFSLTKKEKNQLKKIESQSNTRSDIAASFQNAAFNVIVKKSIRAVEEYKAKSIVIGGGVAANKALAKMIRSKIKKKGLDIKLIVPPIKYCMDNAVMIGLGAYMEKMRNKKYPLKANGNLNV